MSLRTAAISRALLVGVAAVAFLPAVAASQGFRALVRDSASGLPLEGARLRILDSTGATLAEQMTNDQGLVTGRIFADVSVYFAVTRIGYRPFLSQPVAIGPESTAALAFNLVSQAFTLPDLEVEAYYAGALDKNGFNERAREGFGHYVRPSTIERRRDAATSFLDFLTVVPGVSVLYTGDGPTIRLTGVGSVSRACGLPKIYVDGMVSGPPLETIIAPHDVMAIEVYRRPVEVPPRYGGADAACGVLLIWSRRGLP